MARDQSISRREGCAQGALPDFISGNAWTAVRILGALAVAPASLSEICRHAGAPAPRASALLDVLIRCDFVHAFGRDKFALSLPAPAISIAEIVQVVDGDVLRRQAQEDLPEIAEILHRIKSATADILDNFSLAEAIDS